MARCEACEKKIGLLDTCTVKFENFPKINLELCNSCRDEVENKIVPAIHACSSLEELKNIGVTLSAGAPDGMKTIIEDFVSSAESALSSGLCGEMLPDMLLTTSSSFEGYEIEEYLGIVSGDGMFSMGILSDPPQAFNSSKDYPFDEKMAETKQRALTKLTYSAYKKGGNAVIGISFSFGSFSSFSNKSELIGVSASGTCVKLKKK